MIPFVEVRIDGFFANASQSMDFPPHLHSEIEIVLASEGSFCLQIDDQEYEISAGQGIIVFPNKIHSLFSRQEGRGLMLIFPHHLVPQIGFDWEHTEPVCPVVDNLPPEVLYARDRMLDYLPTQQITRRLHAQIHKMVALMVHNMKWQPSSRSGTPDALYRTMIFLSQHYCEELTLKTVAKAAGISESYLSHLFGAHMKTDFRHYLNVLRLNKAGILLVETDLPMEDVATQCGFKCLRSFDRAFQRAHNCTPSAYRRQRYEMP